MKLKCSFQNVQQNGKILTRLTKKNKVKAQITKIRNKNRHYSQIYSNRKIIRKYYE